MDDSYRPFHGLISQYWLKALSALCLLILFSGLGYVAIAL